MQKSDKKLCERKEIMKSRAIRTVFVIMMSVMLAMNMMPVGVFALTSVEAQQDVQVIISKLESHQLQKREPLRIAGLGATRGLLSRNNIWK